MKRIVLSFLAIIMFFITFAQKETKTLTRGKTLGIHFFLEDFSSGRALDSGDKFKTVMDRKIWNKPSQLTPGFAISYAKGLTPQIDLRANLATSFVDYLFKKRATFGGDDYLGEFDIAGNFKAVNDNHLLIPYINLGIGASYARTYVGAYVPVGLGLQLNLFKDAYIDLQTQARIGLTDNATTHLYHSIGVLGNIFTQKRVKTKYVAPVIATVLDTDGDGVNDDVDQCPKDFGLASLNGCPDKDGDGIADKNDNCPDKAGVAKYNGCPVPDSDGDGINDEEDKCPTVAGVAKYNGCPVPDTDGDGINDDEDKCPTVAGVASQQGCPEIKADVVKKMDYAAQQILFETGKSILKTSSFKGLNDVAKIMSENKDVNLNIDGHTDNTGSSDKNDLLSQNRANAVKAYLASKGVSEARMTATGHGQNEPVADNATPAGRAKNRRVELKLGY